MGSDDLLPRKKAPRPSGGKDVPEPRWGAALALVATGAISWALPQSLVIWPRWMLLTLVLVLLIPAMFAHRTGRHALNHALGLIANIVVTVALVGSAALLVGLLPGRKEPPVTLLGSALALWWSNVITFALWYWRLDGGGPNARASKGVFASQAFLFPQLQIESNERKDFGAEGWRPSFVDYLYFAFNTSTAFSPTDTLVLRPWAKLLSMVQAFISLTVTAVLVARAINVL